jgi:hypothetical protein
MHQPATALKEEKWEGDLWYPLVSFKSYTQTMEAS